MNEHRLRPIKTQKQVPYGVPHSQREPAPPPVLITIVKHVASLAERLQIAHPVIAGVVVKVCSRQRHPGCANCNAVANGPSKAASASVAPDPFIFIPPSTVA